MEQSILQDAATVSAPEATLLSLLADNARITNSELAARAGMPASTCLARVNSLRERGIITGFHTLIDRRMIGLSLDVLIGIDLTDSRDECIEAVMAEIRSIPNVVAVMAMAGDHHVLAQAHATSTDALKEQVVNPISALPLVAGTRTNLIFSHYRRASSAGAFHLY